MMSDKRTVLQATRVIVFLVLNNLLASLGFKVLLFGIAFSLGSLALCCLGVVVFQGLLYLAPLLARLDVILHNFVEPVENRLYVNIPHYGERGSTSARASLAVLVYVSTAKLGVGVLSAIVVIIPLSMPIHVLTSPVFRTEYLNGDWFNLWAFLVVATALLVGGFVTMPLVARLSCVTTRLLCREFFSPVYTYDFVSSKPLDIARTSHGINEFIRQV